jgi:hypothetical protein
VAIHVAHLRKLPLQSISGPKQQGGTKMVRYYLSPTIFVCIQVGSVEIIHPMSEREVLEGNAVINRFPFGNQLMSMKEIVAELGLCYGINSVQKFRRPRLHLKLNSRYPYQTAIEGRRGIVSIHSH